MPARWRVCNMLAVAFASLGSAPAGTDLHGDPLPPGAVARLGTTRFRNSTFRVPGLGFSRDGQTIVSSGEGNAVRVFDSHTGRLVRELRLGKLNITGFALSPDGRLAAVGGFAVEKDDQPPTHGVHLVEVATGKVRRTLGREGRMDHCSLAFTPDGKHLVSAGGDGVVRIEEVATGTELLRESLRVNYPRLAVSPDGGAVAIAGPHAPVIVWDWQSGRPPREIKVPPRGASSVSFGRDGKVLATGDDGAEGVRIWDVATGRLLRTLGTREEPDRSEVAFSPDGRHLASTSSQRHGVIVWDAATGQEVRRLPVARQFDGALAWSADSARLAALGAGGLRVWDVASGKEKPTLPEGHWQTPSFVALLADGTAVTAGDDGTVRRWDAATGKPLLTIRGTSHWVRGAAASPDGRRLVTSTLGEDHAVSLWDAKSGRLIYRLPGHGRVGGLRVVAFTPDSKRFLSWGDDMYLRTWEVRNGKAVAEHAIRPDGEEVPDLDDPSGQRLLLGRLDAGAFSRDGARLVLAGRGGFFLFDTKTGKQEGKIKHEQGHVAGIAVSPDGKLLLTSAWGRPRRLRLPDGRTRFSSGDGVLTLHDLSTGKLVRELSHALRVAGPVAFRGDGKLFVAASSDQKGSIIFHDAATGALRGTIDGLPARVWSLGFSPDGKRVIAGLEDSTALVYLVPEKADRK